MRTRDGEADALALEDELLGLAQGDGVVRVRVLDHVVGLLDPLVAAVDLGLHELDLGNHHERHALLCKPHNDNT